MTGQYLSLPFAAYIAIQSAQSQGPHEEPLRPFYLQTKVQDLGERQRTRNCFECHRMVEEGTKDSAQTQSEGLPQPRCCRASP